MQGARLGRRPVPPERSGGSARLGVPRFAGLHGGEGVERLHHAADRRELGGIGKLIILRHRHDVVLDHAQVILFVRGCHHQCEAHLARLLRQRQVVRVNIVLVLHIGEVAVVVEVQLAAVIENADHHGIDYWGAVNDGDKYFLIGVGQQHRPGAGLDGNLHVAVR